MTALTVYADVLIILNVYVNYFLLRTTAKLTHSPLRTWRCIAASFYGSLYSLLILAPRLPLPFTIAIKLASAVTIVAAAFGLNSAVRVIKNTVAFFCANFIFGGVIYAVCSWLKPSSVHFGNSYFYIDFSLLLLVITTAVLYGAVCLLRRFTDKDYDSESRIFIRSGSRTIGIDGFADTGNRLVDCFSGRPVIICGREDVGSVSARLHLIPCSTVSDSGVMPVFRPDEVVIVNTATGEKKPVDVMIGIGETGGKAIYNPKIIKH